MFFGGKETDKKFNTYGKSSIFRLKIHIFKLQIRIFRLQIYIFSLKIKFCSEVSKFFLGENGFSLGSKPVLSGRRCAFIRNMGNRNRNIGSAPLPSSL